MIPCSAQIGIQRKKVRKRKRRRDGDALCVEEEYDGALAAYSDVSAVSISQPPVPHQQEEGSIAPCRCPVLLSDQTH